MPSKKPPGKVRLGIPSVEGDYTDAGMGISHIPFDVKRRLVAAINTVIRRLCTVRSGFAREHKDQLFPCGYILQDVGTFDKGVPEDLRSLVARIDEAIMAGYAYGYEAGYAYGYEEGTSLLRGLAAGTTSIQAFNEATITERDD